MSRCTDSAWFGPNATTFTRVAYGRARWPWITETLVSYTNGSTRAWFCPEVVSSHMFWDDWDTRTVTQRTAAISVTGGGYFNAVSAYDKTLGYWRRHPNRGSGVKHDAWLMDRLELPSITSGDYRADAPKTSSAVKSDSVVLAEWYPNLFDSRYFGFINRHTQANGIPSGGNILLIDNSVSWANASDSDIGWVQTTFDSSRALVIAKGASGGRWRSDW